jgi:hypothetical protein
MAKYRRLISFVGLTMLLTACDDGYQPQPPVELFSQEAKFVIGETVLSVPLVTIVASEQRSKAIVPCDEEGDKIEHYCNLSYRVLQ